MSPALLSLRLVGNPTGNPRVGACVIVYFVDNYTHRAFEKENSTLAVRAEKDAWG